MHIEPTVFRQTNGVLFHFALPSNGATSLRMSGYVKYLDAVANASSVEELWALHTEKMNEYGFDRIIYGFTRYLSGSSLGDPQDWVVLSNHGEAYMKGFIDDGYCYHAPMLRWALENTGASSWRWMAENTELTDLERRHMQFNIENDVTAGYTVSFLSVSERIKGAIALTARKGMTQDDIDAVWAEHGDEITLANNMLHLKLQTLPYAARNLTKRQREVLQWVGDGKTTQDIAIILELTPATIEKHLRLAREALDVETTAQAVLKAAFYNQMFVIEPQAA